MPPTKNGNEALLQALREQNRKFDVLVDIAREQKKIADRANPPSGPSSVSQFGSGFRGSQTFGAFNPPQIRGAEGASGIGAASGMIADVIKRGVESGFGAAASSIRSSSPYSDMSRVDAEANRQGMQGFKTGLLRQVPIVGEWAAARSDAAFNRQTARDFAIYDNAAEATMNRLSGLARAQGIAGQGPNAELASFIYQQERKAFTGYDAYKGITTAFADSEKTALLQKIAEDGNAQSKAQLEGAAVRGK